MGIMIGFGTVWITRGFRVKGFRLFLGSWLRV